MTRKSARFIALFIAFAFPQMAIAMPFTLTGKLEFQADYPSAIPGNGDIPSGKSPVPYLFVCAYDADGAVDFKTMNYPMMTGNDEGLGCARADVSGNYTISAHFNEEEAPDIYLATKLCDNSISSQPSPADVCVLINTDPGDDDAHPDNVKVMWTQVYNNVSVSPNDVVSLSWNLSCPNGYGLGMSSVNCSGSVEPASWNDAVVCSSGNTNSSTGCNKEAVHAYRGAIEPYKTWGSNKPDAGSTFMKSCPDSAGSDHCDTDECQDEVKFHLSRIVDGSGVFAYSSCDPTNTNNGARDYDDICVATPMNPYRVVHELGHVVDMRWRCDENGSPSCSTSWTTSDPNCERKEVREGWANFVASAAWHGENDTNPVYCMTESTCYNVETNPTCSGSGQDGEGAVTKFFWDLRDNSDDGGAECDTEDWSFAHVRNIFSAFPYGTSDMETREDRGLSTWSDGANAWDFTYHWNAKRGSTYSFCQIQADTCAADHVACSGCASICP